MCQPRVAFSMSISMTSIARKRWCFGDSWAFKRLNQRKLLLQNAHVAKLSSSWMSGCRGLLLSDSRRNRTTQLVMHCRIPPRLETSPSSASSSSSPPLTFLRRYSIIGMQRQLRHDRYCLIDNFLAGEHSALTLCIWSCLQIRSLPCFRPLPAL